MVLRSELAAASQKGGLKEVVLALEDILDRLESAKNTGKFTAAVATNGSFNENKQNQRPLDVLDDNSLLSLLQSRLPNKHGELMKCVSLLFFIPAVETSGPVGMEHRSLVNAFVSSIEAPISCAVQRGSAGMVEVYLALLVLSKVVSLSSPTAKRIFKTADYRALTFLEWLGQVKFFGRSKKKDAYRTLYSEWALHAGNDDTLRVLTHNEYTIRQLAAMVCAGPTRRMLLRPNFFYGDRPSGGWDIDYDGLFCSASENESNDPAEPRDDVDQSLCNMMDKAPEKVPETPSTRHDGSVVSAPEERPQPSPEQDSSSFADDAISHDSPPALIPLDYDETATESPRGGFDGHDKSIVLVDGDDCDDFHLVAPEEYLDSVAAEPGWEILSS